MHFLWRMDSPLRRKGEPTNHFICYRLFHDQGIFVIGMSPTSQLINLCFCTNPDDFPRDPVLQTLRTRSPPFSSGTACRFTDHQETLLGQIQEHGVVFLPQKSLCTRYYFFFRQSREKDLATLASRPEKLGNVTKVTVCFPLKRQILTHLILFGWNLITR